MIHSRNHLFYCHFNPQMYNLGLIFGGLPREKRVTALSAQSPRYLRQAAAAVGFRLYRCPWRCCTKEFMLNTLLNNVYMTVDL